MSIIKPLPSWAIINRFPAFYEGESLTAIEQTARVYEKINELITTYNKYVTEINGELTELEQHTDQSLNCAIKTIIRLTDSYITEVDLRLSHQDRKLDETYKALSEDIANTIDDIIAQMKESGELDEQILNAIDGLNTKFTALETGVDAEIAALKSAYESAEQRLFEDYNSYKAEVYGEIVPLQHDVENLKTETTGLATQFYTFTAKGISELLAFPERGDIIGAQVRDIADYSAVRTSFFSSFAALCDVQMTDDGYVITGRGTNYKTGSVVNTDGVVSGVIHDLTVKITTDDRGVITKDDSVVVTYQVSNTGFTVSSVSKPYLKTVMGLVPNYFG